MIDILKLLQKNLETSIDAKQQMLFDQSLQLEFSKAVTAVINCYKAGGRLYIAGNGGSAADAQHLAAEFVSKLVRDRVHFLLKLLRLIAPLLRQ